MIPHDIGGKYPMHPQKGFYAIKKKKIARCTAPTAIKTIGVCSVCLFLFHGVFLCYKS